jgi:hypothetical protein
VVPLKRRRRLLRWISGGLAAAAAAAALLVVFSGDRGSAPTDPTVELTAEIRPGGEVVRGGPDRGDHANVGDTLVVGAEATGPVEIRVYGGSSERLLATCNDRGGCAVTRDGERRRFVLEVPLETPGTVRAVVFVGANLPASAGSLGPDLERAEGAGIQTKPGTQKRVL